MTEDWLDILRALIDAGAGFLVVGVHAMAVHGVPRGTQDFDLWVDNPENAARVWRADARTLQTWKRWASCHRRTDCARAEAARNQGRGIFRRRGRGALSYAYRSDSTAM